MDASHAAISWQALPHLGCHGMNLSFTQSSQIFSTQLTYSRNSICVLGDPLLLGVVGMTSAHPPRPERGAGRATPRRCQISGRRIRRSERRPQRTKARARQTSGADLKRCESLAVSDLQRRGNCSASELVLANGSSRGLDFQAWASRERLLMSGWSLKEIEGFRRL